MKGNNLLLNNEIDSEFLMLISNRNQSIKVKGERESPKQSLQQMLVGKLLLLVLMAASHYGIKLFK